MSSLRAVFLGLPRPVWTLFAGTMVNRLGYVVTPFLVFYLGARGVSTREIPWVLGALGVGNLLGPALGGLLADRIGRRTTMLAGLLGTATAQGALYLAPGPLTMAGAALLLSTSGATVSPAAYALMADAVGADRRQAAYGLFGWGINLGTAVAGVLGGFLAQRGYWLLFAVDAGTALGYAAVVLTMLPRDRQPAAGPGAVAHADRDGVGYGVVLRDRLLLSLLGLFGVSLFVYSLTESVLPLAIRDAGLSPAVYGAMAAVNAVVVVVLQPVATARLARFPQLPVQVGASVLIVAGVALTGVARSPLGFALTVLLWSVGEAAASGIAAAMVANLAPAHARGRYQGAFGWVWGVARFTSLTLGVVVYTDLGPGVLWTATLGAGLVAALGTLALRTRIDARADVPGGSPEAAAVVPVSLPEADAESAAGAERADGAVTC